jgi:hypothetical protein
MPTHRSKTWTPLIGRPFQGRYKALHVEPGNALGEVCHYIHLNPVRAGAVELDRLPEFARSSLAWFARKDRPGCLEPVTVLTESGGLSDTAEGWRKYQDYLGFMAEEEVALKNKRFGRLSRGWMVGSKEFSQALKKDLLQRGADLERAQMLGCGAVKEWRAEQWRAKLEDAAKLLGADLANLPARKSAEQKVMLAALLKRTTSVSNDWLAQQLKMGKPASVSQFVRRFNLSKKVESPAFTRLLSTVKT